jgi:hypothetical protein
LLGTLAIRAEDLPPAPGFSWKHFPESKATVQVPDGWHSRILAEHGAKALQVTKEKVGPKGFETGLTINLTERQTDSEASAATIGIGNYMAKLHDTFKDLVESRVTETNGVLTMILEGTRTLPNEPERGLYHTRTGVYIFKPQRRIYTIIFGSPAGSWENEFKIGTVMFNPIQFDAD